MALCEAIGAGVSCIGAKRLARWRKAWGPTLDARRVDRWVRSELLRHRDQ
jgi:hypothetical protein